MYKNYFSNFGRPLVPDDVQKFSPEASSVLEKIFKGFYHIWAWRPSWSTDRNHFSNLSFPQPKEAPYEIWAKLALQLQRRSRLKMLLDGQRTKSDHNSSGELKSQFYVHPQRQMRELKRQLYVPIQRQRGELKSQFYLLTQRQRGELKSKFYVNTQRQMGKLKSQIMSTHKDKGVS